MNVATDLMRLETAQLVRALSEVDPAYMFRHTLVQETAYGSLLVKSRRDIHRRIARCYEQLYAEKLEEYVALLAYHYHEAGDPGPTLKYAALAGDAAFQRSANAEAIKYYTIALEIAVRAGGLPGGAASIPIDTPNSSPITLDDASRLVIHLCTRRGRALELSGQYEAALDNYAEMAELARARGDRALELAALIAQTTARSTPTRLQDLTLAQELSAEALVLARALDDPAAEAKILWNRSLMGYFMSQPGQAVADGEQAIAIARQLGLREQLAYALHDIARSYVALGQLERGRSALEEAETLWRELGNKQLLADCLNGAIEVYAMKGDYERCLAIADESIRLSKEVGNHWGLAYSAALQGLVFAERAEYAAAITCLNESLELAQLSGFAYPFVIARLPLAAIYYTVGDYGRAQDELNLAMAAAKLLPMQVLPAILASLALIQLATGDIAAARATSRRSLERIAFDDATVARLALAAPMPWMADIEVRLADSNLDTLLASADRMLTGVRRFRIRPYLSDALYARGRVLLALGRAEEAWDALDEARAEASAIGCRRTLWRILETMSAEATRRGNNESALKLAEQARQVIDTIAAHAGSDELRDSFLGLPQVRRVLALVEAHDAGF